MVYTPFGLLDPTTVYVALFIFVFAVVFGILSITKIFTKGVNTLVAFALAIFAISYQPFVVLLWSYLPTFIWIFVILFFIAFIARLFGLSAGKMINFSDIATNAVALLLLMTLGWQIFKYFPSDIPFIGNQENFMFTIGLIFVLMLIWAIFKYQTEVEAEYKILKEAAEQAKKRG